MKAFLLSAGLGTRLRPLTNDLPKCLVEICGKPLLYIWLDLLEKYEIDEVLINTHYFAEKVERAVKKRCNKIKIKLFYEENLIGSGGTILVNEQFVKDEKNFFFIFADNLTNVSLKKIWDFHILKNSLFTTYVYKTNIPKQKGIFVVDNNCKVIDFEEKPQFPKSNLANAGIGVLSTGMFDILRSNTVFREKSEKLRVKDKEVIDFGRDVMPLLLANMYVMETSDYIRDIGSIEDLNEARREFGL